MIILLRPQNRSPADKEHSLLTVVLWAQVRTRTLHRLRSLRCPHKHLSSCSGNCIIPQILTPAHARKFSPPKTKQLMYLCLVRLQWAIHEESYPLSEGWRQSSSLHAALGPTVVLTLAMTSGHFGLIRRSKFLCVRYYIAFWDSLNPSNLVEG